MLHLDANRVLNFVVSEQLKACNTCHVLNGVIVVLFEELFVLERDQVLVFDPFIDLCSRFTGTTGVPSRVTRFE